MSGLFGIGTRATGQTNDVGSRPSYVNEEGTAELRNYVNSTIVSNHPDVDRVTRYQLYWYFYNGKHWRAHNDTFLSFNYIRAFINKVNSFLLGDKGFSLEVQNELDETPSEGTEKTAEAIINYIWKQNKGVQKQYEILQTGSVTGDVWMHLQYRENADFDDMDQNLCIDCLDSRHCFPEFEDGDYSRLRSFMLRQPMAPNKDRYVVRVTRYTKTTYETWYQKDTIRDPKQTSTYEFQSQKNPWGFIPVVHAKNKPHSDGYYGVSDCADILKINKIYNELAQSIKETLDYYTSPVTVITGGTVKALTKGIGRLWSGLPAEANVFNLGLGEDLNASMAFLLTLKTALHELSDVPENALGKLQAISNTSAAALEITYQPLKQQADSKAITYSEGFILLHKMMFRMVRIFQQPKYLFDLIKKLPVDFEKTHSVVPVYTYGLPKDRMSMLQEAQVEQQLQISDRKGIMNRLGYKNVPGMLKDIDADKIRMATVDGKAGLLNGTIQPEEPGNSVKNGSGKTAAKK